MEEGGRCGGRERRRTEMGITMQQEVVMVPNVLFEILQKKVIQIWTGS